ncbi:hypothetical protein L083_0342 [Actinoplanes sp. N902-109]|nr:hypothetical protein L083_0342 [Actinoplanes sp. N902-109]
MRRWVISKNRAGGGLPWELWLANGLDRWFIARRSDHAGCVIAMNGINAVWARADQLSKVDWAVDERTDHVRLDVAGYRPPNATARRPGGVPC